MSASEKNPDVFSRIKNRIKQASSNVTTKVEATKGDHKVVMSSSSIDHYYKNEIVSSIKVAQFSDEEIEAINVDPQTTAQNALDEFIANFNPANIKEAANKALDKNFADKITQKQLDDNNVKLHPRTNDYPVNVTEKQIPEDNQRPGTYDVITQAQLRDERKTFYGDPRTAGDWRQEDRDVITEGQFDNGVSDYTDVGASERGEMGAKFDGDLAKQHKQTGEKQLEELLKHHTWSMPMTTTENQLKDQDGELARLTAEAAQQIIKEATEAFGKTVIAAGVTPSELANITKKLISDKSKYPVFASVLKEYANLDVSAINKKIAKAQHFGKTANAGQDWSENLVADVLTRQLAKIKAHPNHIARALAAMANTDNFIERISSASEEALKQTQESGDELSVFNEVLAGKLPAFIQEKIDAKKNKNKDDDKEDDDKDNEKEASIAEGSADEDGMYAYAGLISEISVGTEDRDAFAKAATTFSSGKILEKIGKKIDLNPVMMDVDEAKGVFEIHFQDPSFKGANLETRAENRRKLAKEAQMGGAGGMPPTGSPDMANPAPPPGAGDMSAGPQAPAESLNQPPPGEMPEESTSSEPSPPGTRCPACGGEDVDQNRGEWKCNSCKAAGETYVMQRVTNWPNIIEDSDDADEEKDKGLDLETDVAPEGEITPSSVPVAASFRLTPRILEKLSSQKINLGSVCPNCGSSNTDLSKAASRKGQDGICWDCLQEYNFQVKAHKSKPNSVYPQYIWTPSTSNDSNCSSCNRVKQAFVNSLNNYGMSLDEFSKIKNPIEQANVVLKMSKSGSLNIKEAMSQPLPLNKIAASSRWKEYKNLDKFPMASCVEKVARRYGENATSMSGPCEGKKLSDCVCKQLQSMGIYSDGLAAKVASVQASEDPAVNNPMKTCIATLVKEHSFDIKDACTVCDSMRAVYASAEELVIEHLAQVNPYTKPQPNTSMFNNNVPMGNGNPNPTPAPNVQPAPRAGQMPNAPARPNAPKPLEINPIEEPVSDLTPDPMGSPEGHMDIEIGGGSFDNFNDDINGFGNEGVTIKLPQSAVEAIEVLLSAIKGQLSPDMIDQTPDMNGMNDMEDMSDGHPEMGDSDMSDDNGELPEEALNSEEPLGETSGPESLEGDESKGGSENSDVPGLDEEKSDGDELDKHSEDQPEEKSDNLFESKSDDSDSSSDSEENEESEESDKPDFGDKEASTEAILMGMKTGTIKTQNQAMNSLFDRLMGQAKFAAKENDIKKVEYKNSSEGSKVTAKPAQDAKEIGKFQDGGSMGHEDSFSKGVKTKPDVPRGDALLGDEGKEMKVNEDGDAPKIPSGNAQLEGEKNYKPEKQTTVDGNQGGNKVAHVKTACKCGDKGCECNCGKSECMKPCAKCASTNSPKLSDKYTVKQNNKNYDSLSAKAKSDNPFVKLSNGSQYKISFDLQNNLILEKESQEKSLTKVKSLDEDKNLGDIQADKPHSLAVDEQKPSEGMNEPEVPKAPNEGRLSREHTVDKAKDVPSIPTGKGMNPDYDNNEKNTPEKTNEMLGTQKNLVQAKRQNAIKIASQLLKANLISADDLPNKIAELETASDDQIKIAQESINKASKGLRGTKDGTENSSFINKEAAKNEPKRNLTDNLQSMFKLDQRNKDFERYSSEKENKLWH